MLSLKRLRQEDWHKSEVNLDYIPSSRPAGLQSKNLSAHHHHHHQNNNRQQEAFLLHHPMVDSGKTR